jgi:hypothetical protein
MVATWTSGVNSMNTARATISRLLELQTAALAAGGDISPGVLQRQQNHMMALLGQHYLQI